VCCYTRGNINKVDNEVDKRKCKACSTSVRITNDAISEMINTIINSNQFEIADDKSYNYRLEQCLSCNYLQYDTTCMQCGCIVHVRAKLKNSTCPYPQKAKWV
jgi:hypothetical protein